MQQRFGRGLSSCRRHDFAFGIHLEDLLRSQSALVERTRGDCKTKWTPAHDGAEIPAGPERPTTAVEVASKLGQVFRWAHAEIIAAACKHKGTKVDAGFHCAFVFTRMYAKLAFVSVEKVRGRGASSNPPNRFEKISYETSEWDEPEDPSRHTVFLKDDTRTIINYNDSPDVGFNASINPYRGCEHGCI